MKEALLHQRKNRQKVLAEILIHRSLEHPNIVRFHDLFQDDANVYFKLELCAHGVSPLDMHSYMSNQAI